MSNNRTSEVEGYQWPAGVERTPERERRPYPGGFEVSRQQAFDSIIEELEKYDAVNVDVQTAGPMLKDQPHRPYASFDGDDPTVVVYFDREGRGYVVPCDKWDSLRDNARAIALYLKSKRAIERYGVGTMNSELSTQALPSGDEDVLVAGDGRSRIDPYEWLGVSPEADPSIVKAAIRQMKGKHHPDNENNPKEYRRAQRVEEELFGDD